MDQKSQGKVIAAGIIIAIFLSGYWLSGIVQKEIKKNSKPYTVRIINGSPDLCYEAKLQIDSFKILSSKCAFVYADGNFLKINAELITITKN